VGKKLDEGVGLLIQMTDVTKVYSNGSVALSAITVDIAKGDFVFIVGPSGAGKSTFIKMLLREEWPTSGRIIVNGRNITELSPREVPFLRRGLGIVFQDYRLLPNKSVLENVSFAMEVIETPRREIQKRVHHVLELVGLRNRSRNLPTQLSGGEQQRVAIARAIVNKPQVVLADEPTGNLDPDTSWEIMKIFEKINHDGTTIVMATHDKMVVDAMKRRVIAIEKGRIARDQQRGVYGYED
jgi:cell division transport system ATP-binding protein